MLYINDWFWPYLQSLHRNILFFPEKREINGGIKLMYFFDNGNHVCHFRLLQQALKHGLILRKVCAVAKFNESR